MFRLTLTTVLTTTSVLALTAGGIAQAAENVLEEIVVTAQKRNEIARDVPLSISVFSRQKLEQISAVQLLDYSGYIPGFNVVSGGTPGQNQLTLRGVTSGPQSSSTVGVYVDDVPVGSSSSYGQGGRLSLDMMPYDIARVEVLRGPQGTLYGASAMGGTMKYAMVSPNLKKLEIRAGANTSTTDGAGNLGWGVRASLNIPLVNDKLAVRASAFRQHRAGYIDNPGADIKDENDGNQTGGRLALMWAPDENLTIKLSAILQKIDFDDRGLIALDPVTGQPRDGDLTRSHILREPFKQKFGLYTATVNWSLDWATVTSASSFAHSTTSESNDNTPLYGGFLGVPTKGSLDLTLDKYTQELRLASSSGSKIEWLLGAFYTHENSKNNQAITPLDPVTGESFAPLNPFLVVGLPSKYSEYAVFGDLTYKLTDKFDVTGGLRWAHNRQKFRQLTNGLGFNPLDPTAVTSVPGKSSDSVVTFMASPRYHLTEDTMLYVRVASGYRPGGPNVTLPNTPPTFGPDKLVNYEAGIKTRFLDQRASVDLSVFYIDWKDIQVVIIDPDNGNSYLGNGGKAKSKGMEFSGEYMPMDGLLLGANLAYTDAYLTADVISVGGLANDNVPNVPKWSGSLTANYQFSLVGDWMASIGGGYRHVGKRNSAFSGDPSLFVLKSYDAVDLNASVFDNHWSARIYVKNLTNERGYISGSPNGSAFDATVLQPQTFGISLDTTF